MPPKIPQKISPKMCLSESSDSSSDTSSDSSSSISSDSDGEPKQLKLVSKSTVSTIEKNANITTEGISEHEKNNIKPGYKLFQCNNHCDKWFTEDLMMPYTKEEQQCYHCYFYFNYSQDSDKRAKTDSKYSSFGITIANYILACHKDHKKCSRSTMSGGCYLCEHNMGFKLDGILNADMLYDVSQSNTSNISSDSHPAKNNVDDNTCDVIMNEDKWFNTYFSSKSVVGDGLSMITI